jgi:hypothetical protein
MLLHTQVFHFRFSSFVCSTYISSLDILPRTIILPIFFYLYKAHINYYIKLKVQESDGEIIALRKKLVLKNENCHLTIRIDNWYSILAALISKRESEMWGQNEPMYIPVTYIRASTIYSVSVGLPSDKQDKRLIACK